MKYSIQFYYFILQLKKHLFLSYFILMRLLNDKNASVIWKYLHLVVRLRILYIFYDKKTYSYSSLVSETDLSAIKV